MNHYYAESSSGPDQLCSCFVEGESKLCHEDMVVVFYLQLHVFIIGGADRCCLTLEDFSSVHSNEYRGAETSSGCVQY